MRVSNHSASAAAGNATDVTVFEAVPVLQTDLSLPVWAFSARAKHAAGGAPAVVCLKKPKHVAEAIHIVTGQPSNCPQCLVHFSQCLVRHVAVHRVQQMSIFTCSDDPMQCLVPFMH